MSNYITHDLHEDEIDRRGFLKSMAWVGTASLCALKGGVPTSFAMSQLGSLDEATKQTTLFAQISDRHIGFSKEANKDVTATLREAVAKLNALPARPRLVLIRATSPSFPAPTSSTLPIRC